METMGVSLCYRLLWVNIRYMYTVYSNIKDNEIKDIRLSKQTTMFNMRNILLFVSLRPQNCIYNIKTFIVNKY